ncbi:MAG: DEAD/DEAH box helicase [Deltaproteobacteria bacterium]|nr:DEAD/DEAH box helicase [Deltaproteobacteria bacterium]
MARFPQLEFHRNGTGLAIPPEEETQAWAMLLVAEEADGRPMRSCTCQTSRTKTCRHLKELSKAFVQARRSFVTPLWREHFEASIWYRLAKLLFDSEPLAAVDVEAVLVQQKTSTLVRVATGSQEILAEYLDPSPARLRFLERLHKAPEGTVARGQLLDRLAHYQATGEERRFADLGMKLGRQVWEESFWHRLAYHGFREFAEEGLSFAPSINKVNGDFRLTVKGSLAAVGEVGAHPSDSAAPGGAQEESSEGEREALVSLFVPRGKVRSVLKFLAAELPEEPQLQIHPVPLKSLFVITPETELDVEVRPMISLLQATGEKRFFARDDLDRFRYGNLIYLADLEILAELEKPGKERRFKAPERVQLARSQVPGFLSEFHEAVDAGALLVDSALGEMEIHREFDRIELSSGQIDDQDYRLLAHCRIGSHSVAVAEILKARADGRPYLEVGDGWLDLNAPSMIALAEAARPDEGLEAEEGEAGEGSTKKPGGEERVRLSSSALLHLRAVTDRPVEVADGAEGQDFLERLLELRPGIPFHQPKGFSSQLRPYQVLGVDWLRWVWDNRLAGLLADDMGLGKTHQAMALMVSLLEQEKVREPMLVICPTSVLSHWEKQIGSFAPGLRVRVRHGPKRQDSLPRLSRTVILTSYGVLRRDADLLASRSFSVVIFDEIQHLKNRGTQAYQSAERLVARLKVGLTGTPVENALQDLKSLFDLLLPGYLGTQARFVEQWGPKAQPTRDDLARLRRLIEPFVLRRTKEAVLQELPSKFEEERSCRLSADQAELYRLAVEQRGKTLSERLANQGEPVPYIHVFALLSYLKQVCDHPALALKDLDRADSLRCGKWELFCEILDEALASGHKVVVFTQFLGMITLMSRYLDSLGVGYEELTGASTNRGERIDRFNEDPECRVFLGSLKAGGTGIDLQGGSVVIHYDRWWNAAREDQATDRVHRMGQKRAVHVVKLVTEGTLEERIASIIEDKRQLMADIVQEDDPSLAKIFSRGELLELLSPARSVGARGPLL